MSENVVGLPRPEPAPVRDAAVVVLHRRVDGRRELFWVRRDRALAFAGGFYAFPGGKVDASDARVPVEGRAGSDAALTAAAARELFEETGVLVASGADALPDALRSDGRRAVLEGHTTFGEFLAAHGLALQAARFPAAGRWVTPPFLPTRFDARLYLVEVPPGATAHLLPGGELVEGEWLTPAEALTRWAAGRALLHPPALHAISVLARWTTREEALDALQHPPHCPGNMAARIEFQQGMRVFPVESDTLPPATHTNCLVLGNRELLVVDPGASSARQQARLFALLAGLEADGLKAKAVFLTHHHADHVGGARALAQRLKLPVWAHAETARRLDLPVERQWLDGEVLELAGDPVMRFEVVHTPGHAPGHLCLIDSQSRAAVVGDMVAGVGTVVIDPPDGDMAEYLNQLRRLQELKVGALYPGHGPVMPDGPTRLEEYLAHRQMREDRVRGALRAVGRTVEELVAEAYDDTPEVMHALAARSALAILLKLESEKKARRDQEYWRVAPGGRE